MNKSNGAFVIRNNLSNEQALILTYVSEETLIDLSINNTLVSSADVLAV